MPSLLLLLVACANSDGVTVTPLPQNLDTASTVDTAYVSDTDLPVDTDTGVVDTGAEPDPPVVVEESGGDQDSSDLAGWLFGFDKIHEVEITLSDASEAALGALPYDWATGSVSIDGETLARVGVRLRGKIGSFRSLSGKPKFKLSFNEYVDDQRFYGLEELTLNNSVVDCSYMREVLGYYAYGLAGVPTLRTSYANVTVNGAPYGLYVLVETPSDKWLERTYANPDGNLYDGKYVYYPYAGGYSYTLLDFGDGVDALFQLEEGTDVANADITEVSVVLSEQRGRARFYAEMGAVLDWDNYHRLTAVDQFLGHADGYSMNTNNYRVYFDPADGKADLLPWDLDYAFIHDFQWGLDWHAANGNITNACFADATCYAAQGSIVSDFLETWNDDDWEAVFDQVDDLTLEAARADPRRECAAADVTPDRNFIRSWLSTSEDTMGVWWRL